MARNRQYFFLFVAIVGFLLVRLWLLPQRVLDPDELEHAHAAWCVSRGLRLYQDFFEHHTPWYYYLLRPFFRWFAVDQSFDSAVHFLFFGRALSLALTVPSLVLVWWIGRLWRDGRTGLLAALLLVGQAFFMQKTMEMRPDVLALPFYLLALGCLLRGAQSQLRERWFAGAGLALGGAVMCTQKMLFVFPGLGVGLGLWWLGADGRRSNLKAIAGFVLTVPIPGLLTLAGFARQGAARAFINNNFLLNARWKSMPTDNIYRLVVSSAPILVLALIGVLRAAGRGWRHGRRDPGDLLLGCTLIGLFAGLLAIPVAQRQYYLMPLPLACLFSADALLAGLDRAAERARPALLALLLVPLSIMPVRSLIEAHRLNNQAQLAGLRQVFETTKPTDQVMDGWQGLGVFRPHPFYYSFFHDELRQMLPRDELDGMMSDLETGRVRPRLIALDRNLRSMGPRFLAVVQQRYTSRDGFFYYARD
ncbi:MAG TPA: glycosyltransferase family 39 protein [Polyangia bacterium]|nr:glycosyltransferase family 39 protein [Polyangia bacterium]